MKLIDKDKVSAKIEGLSAYLDTLHEQRIIENILSFIDTLEVKEVDLEKETDEWYNNKAPKEFENVLYKDIEKCAKYFFELGLKAQKGKTRRK